MELHTLSIQTGKLGDSKYIIEDINTTTNTTYIVQKTTINFIKFALVLIIMLCYYVHELVKFEMSPL